MKKIAIVALLSTAVMSSAAFAAAPGFYAAADLGQVSYSNANGGPTGTTAFPNPTGIRLAGGYHYNANLAVEVGYAIIGDSIINTTIVGAGTAKETIKASSLQLFAVGTFPINDAFSVFGKLGVANDKIDYTITSNIFSCIFYCN